MSGSWPNTATWSGSCVGPPGLRRVLYLVTHPDGVEQVLAGDPGGYTKNTPYYKEIAAYLGNGLLTSDGQRWRQQRRTVAPLFTHRRIAGYVDVMADEAARVADRWADAAARGAPVDVERRWSTTRCGPWGGCSSAPTSTTPSR